MTGREINNQVAKGQAEAPGIGREEALPGGLLSEALKDGSAALYPEMKGELLDVLHGRHAGTIAEETAAKDFTGEAISAARLEQSIVTLGRLGDRGLDVVSSVALHALSTDDRRLLGDSLTTLGALNQQVGSVIGCLRTYDGPLSVRTEALDLLTGMNRPFSAMRAIELMRSDDPNMQGDALMALAGIDAGLALKMAMQVSANPEAHEIVKASADYVIASVGAGTQPANLHLTSALDPLRDSVSMSLSALHGSGAAERLLALGWLRQHNPEVACCVMADRLRDPDPQVRLTSLLGIISIDGRAAELHAPPLVTDRSADVAALAKKVTGQV
jgi:hypothetical protein